jgi:hypothetical protein
MSLQRISPQDIEVVSVQTNPIRHYTSSSSETTGFVQLFPRQTHLVKDIAPSTSYVDLTHDDADLSSLYEAVVSSGKGAVANSGSWLANTTAHEFTAKLEQYLDAVTSQITSARNSKVLDVVRFTPGVTFSQDTVSKLLVKNILNSYYNTTYPSAHWGFTNYNTLNFFTASTVPTSSVLIYPNVDTTHSEFHEGYVSGTYTPSGSFSFDFYINPRYKQALPDTDYHAGTILHLSSTYALSLISGSARDENGKASAFRLQLQLSHSADVKPSIAKHGNYPQDLVFLSDDNSLLYNNWHHVVVRWGTDKFYGGTGSFNIDTVDRGTFCVPSGTITPKLMIPEPDVLCVGNYFDSVGFQDAAACLFFAVNPATRDGLQTLVEDGGTHEAPVNYTFDHPLNAELHDLSIRRMYMSNTDIVVSASRGATSLDKSFMLYVPPFFRPTSPLRKFVGDHGGILQTPFFEIDGTTIDPFNVAMSFGVDGHYMNIENYVHDFASGLDPLLHHMTGTAIATTTDARTANDFLYDQSFVVRRNTFIMPCDDGNFVPGYELLMSESNTYKKYVDDLGNQDFTMVNLDNLVTTASLLFGSDFDQGQIENEKAYDFTNTAIGFSPEKVAGAMGPAYTNYSRRVAAALAAGSFEPGLQGFAPLTIYQRTRDPSSNQVTFFSISNMFYGDSIKPQSFYLTDTSLSGTAGALSITLRDDGYGNLYRADCLTKQATWNSCGNLFSNEGLAVIKNPSLNFFGKEKYTIDLRGTRNVHVMKIDVIAQSGQVNSSSNPTYVKLPPSAHPNEWDDTFVQISGVNFHDDNMNVIAKTSFAQPIVKRASDRLVVRTKIDF